MAGRVAPQHVAAHFAALGLPKYASEEEARKAYRALVRTAHPDKGGSTERFQQITKAYDALCAKWDAERKERQRVMEQFAQRGAAVAGPAAKPEGEPAPESDADKSASEAVPELRQGEDAGVLVPSSDLKRLGDEAFEAGDFQRALDYYDTAAAYAKIDNLLKYAELYHCRARTYRALERPAEALNDAERAVQMRPIWQPPYLVKGWAHEQQEQWAAASDAYGVVVDMGPDADGYFDEALDGLTRAEEVLVSQSCCAALHGHAAGIRAVSFCPDPPPFKLHGRDPPPLRVATASDDCTARVWEAPSGKCLGELKGHTAPLSALVWCPDGSGLLVTAAADCLVKMWQVVDPEQEAAAAQREEGGEKAPADGPLRVELLHTLDFHAGPVTDIVFDRFGGVFASVSEDCTARVWDTETAMLVHALPPYHKRMINCACFSPNGRTLTTGSDDQTGRVWDLMGDIEPAGECLHTLGWDSGPVNGVTYTPCGRLIVVVTHTPWGKEGSPSYRLLVWSAVSGRLCKWYDGHASVICSFSWNPCPDEDDGDILVTGSQDGTMRTWEIRGDPTGKGEALMEHSDYAGKGVFRPGYADKLAWGTPWCVRHSADGRLVATGCHDSRVRLYETESWNAVHDWGSHEGPVRAVAWAPEREGEPLLLATASDDGNARLWYVNRIHHDSDDEDDDDDGEDDGEDGGKEGEGAAPVKLSAGPEDEMAELELQVAALQQERAAFMAQTTSAREKQTYNKEFQAKMVPLRQRRTELHKIINGLI